MLLQVLLHAFSSLTVFKFHFQILDDVNSLNILYMFASVFLIGYLIGYLIMEWLRQHLTFEVWVMIRFSLWLLQIR